MLLYIVRALHVAESGFVTALMKLLMGFNQHAIVPSILHDTLYLTSKNNCSTFICACRGVAMILDKGMLDYTRKVCAQNFKPRPLF